MSNFDPDRWLAAQFSRPPHLPVDRRNPVIPKANADGTRPFARPIPLGVEIRCKCHLLTLHQLLELHALECTLIEEVLLAVRRDCPKSAVRDQAGNRSVRHVLDSGTTDASWYART